MSNTDKEINAHGSIAVLPKHVTFKNNGKFLCAQWTEGHEYLRFNGNDSGDVTVWNEVHPIGEDGKVCIKSTYYGKFWRRSPNWIWADSSLNQANLDTVFYPIKLNNTQVALRNLGNNYFCKRLTTEGKESCLNAGTPTITNEAKLDVVELVISREIYDVVYDLSSAKIYNVKPISMTSTEAINGTNSPNETEVKLSYTRTTSSTWNSQVSFTTGIKCTITAGVPEIAETSVEVSYQYSGSYELGETTEKSSTTETVYKVTVPPMKKVTVRVLASEGTCDVPFTYTQRDILINGEEEISKMHGIYTGINAYNFNYETKEEPLKKSSFPLHG